MNEFQRHNVEEIKKCFQSAIEYCDSILGDPSKSESEFGWLIHDWSVKQQEGYNDALMAMFETLHKTYREYFPE